MSAVVCGSVLLITAVRNAPLLLMTPASALGFKWAMRPVRNGPFALTILALISGFILPIIWLRNVPLSFTTPAMTSGLRFEISSLVAFGAELSAAAII
jgi:hypothetical protein